MKEVTLYMDVPEYNHSAMTLFATTNPIPKEVSWCKRFKFKVTLPDTVLKDYDEQLGSVVATKCE